jgi:two-component system, NtrC family, response regulator HydG
MTHENSEYLSNIFEVLDEAVFVYDQDMIIRNFNSRAEEITRFKKEEVIGQKCTTLFKSNICQNNCALCMTAKTGELKAPLRFQSKFIRRDGSERMGDFHVGLINKGDSGRREVMVAITDATEVQLLREELKETRSFRNIIGKSSAMADLFKFIKNIAAYDSTILIQGESGTGKELVAKAIHQESPRSEKRLIKVNCSSLSPGLLESELFGHVKGAFTGALRDREGRFEEANGSSIFLDEVGDLSPRVQVNLLRVLQEKEIERVGDNRTRKVDICIIAATHKDLMAEVRGGRFREDLFYRLNVIPIQLPPLRMRKEDIPLLVEHFVQNWEGLKTKQLSGISPSALRTLMDYDWPGNIRELENVIERACVVCTGKTIEPIDLNLIQLQVSPNIKDTRRRVIDRETILQELKNCGSNQTLAAERLGLHRVTLWRKMKGYGIDA